MLDADLVAGASATVVVACAVALVVAAADN